MSSNSIKSKSSNSLVKYDTPYLVSTTLNNKKALQDIQQDTEKTLNLLKTIFYKTKEQASGDSSDEFSVKDALNKILPPETLIVNDQLWVQYVSCTPVTKMEVVNLKQGLDKRLKILNAKETGVCLIREKLYDECFDDIIRQVTINCLERGILMKLVKEERKMTIEAYQNLYQSSIAFGVRSWLMAEEEKKKLKKQIEDFDEKNEKIEKDIEKLEQEIEYIMKKDEEEREETKEKHNTDVRMMEESIALLKGEIRNKWEIFTKQNALM